MTSYSPYFSDGGPAVPILLIALVVGLIVFFKFPLRRKLAINYLLLLSAMVLMASFVLYFIEGYVILLLIMLSVVTMSIFHFFRSRVKKIVFGGLLVGCGLVALIQFWRVTPYFYLENFSNFLGFLTDPLGRVWLLGLILFVAAFASGLTVLISVRQKDV